MTLPPMIVGPPMEILARTIICGRCSFVFFVVEPEKNLTAKSIPCPSCFRVGANPLVEVST